MIAVRHDAHHDLARDPDDAAEAYAATEWPPATRAALRRRRALLALAALVGLSAIAVLGSDATAAWSVLAAALAASVVYMGLLHRSRRIAAEREFAGIFGPASARLGSLAGAAGVPAEPVTVIPRVISPSSWQHAWGVTKFAAAYVAGWALSPLVFALTLVTGETLKDTTSKRWLASLEAAQARLKEQSLRTIAVSAATTASVTAAGTAAVFSGGGVASAATITASAPLPASTSLPAGPGLAASAGVLYRVVAGDTLSGIAARFGTTVAAIASANGIANPNLIYAGRVITIPGAAAQSGGASSYTVASGDTLSGIAARFGTSVTALAAENHISDPNFIYPGEVLALGGSAAPSLTSASTAPPAPAPASTPAPAGQVAAQVALDQVGKPYQWAGAGPNSYDCSGLVMYAWAHAGVSLPHYSVSQYQDTVRISGSQLQPGDLVFYDTGGGAQPGHVTIYVGGGKVVTADSPGTTVRVVPLDWDGTPMGFGRVR